MSDLGVENSRINKSCIAPLKNIFLSLLNIRFIHDKILKVKNKKEKNRKIKKIKTFYNYQQSVFFFFSQNHKEQKENKVDFVSFFIWLKNLIARNWKNKCFTFLTTFVSMKFANV